MESIRDRFNGRDRMGSERGRDRYDRPDRSDMGERASRRGGGYASSEGLGIDAVTEVIEKSNAKQLEVFADCIDDVKDEVYASEKEILKALDQMASSSATAGRASRNQEPVSAPVDPAMKEDILRAVAGNTELLYAIRDVLAKKEKEEAEQKQQEAVTQEAQPEQQAAPEAEKPLTAILAEYYNNMEEHVHKENVKCYRNVQAAISEQGTQVVDQSKKSLGMLKVFAIVTAVLSLANIALLVCFILGLI